MVIRNHAVEFFKPALEVGIVRDQAGSFGINKFVVWQPACP